MYHGDHVNLLRRGVQAAKGVWVDLGAGACAAIYAVYWDRGALCQLAQAMQAQLPGMTLHTVTADLTRPLDLPSMD
jgi:hypothetical protein